MKMEIRPVINTFFTVTLANNGTLEALGNRIMRPLLREDEFQWIDVSQHRYTLALPKPNSPLMLTIFIVYSFAVGVILGLTVHEQSIKYWSIVGVFGFVFFGMVIKIISWFDRSVREKNFQYMRLRKEEMKTPPTHLLNHSNIEKKVDFKTIKINPQDKLSRLPRILIGVVGEYLRSQDLHCLEMTSKSQLQDISKSSQYLNRTLIKQIFPNTFLNRVGMDKVLQVMSKPPIKIIPSLNTISSRIDEVAYNNVRVQYLNAPKVIAEELWYFAPFQMENQPIRWGKTPDGSVFWVFTYKQHNAPVVNWGGTFPVSGPYGMSVLFQKNNNEQKVLKVAPALEKFGIGYADEHATHTFTMINSFVVYQDVLSIADYIPRLINRKPCGVCTKDVNGNITEGPRTIQEPDGEHAMVELMPLPV